MLIGFLRDLLASPGWLGGIVAVAMMTGGYVWFHWAEALKEKGRDRDRLLRRLRRGGNWRAQYVGRLRRVLARVDRFMGDARRPGWACRRLTGGGPWPCWTARSFDRCALMAVVYPFLSLHATWLISGEAGDLGETLRLRAEPDPGSRIVSAGLIVVVLYTMVKSYRASGRMQSWRLSRTMRGHDPTGAQAWAWVPFWPTLASSANRISTGLPAADVLAGKAPLIRLGNFF